jgi:hypothetical protein
MKIRRVPTRFEPETRFEAPVLPPAPFRADQENALERLKARLLRPVLSANLAERLDTALRRAADEAAALVALTPFPLLFLPEVFAEKAREAAIRARRRARPPRRNAARVAEAA